MAHMLASGFLMATFLGLLLVVGQDAPPVSSLPPPATEEITEDEEVIDLPGCGELELLLVNPVEQPLEGVEAIDPAGPQPGPASSDPLSAGSAGNG